MARVVVAAGIDGTSSDEWARQDGLNSHVRRFIADLVIGNGVKRWWHGPDMLGLKLGGIEDRVYTWIVEQMERLIRARLGSQSDIEVVIVGHSRGAVGAMKVANALAESSVRIAVSRELSSPIRVKYVGLYDAVDRAIGFSPDTELVNVESCYHAARRNISTDPERGSRGTFGTVDVAHAREQEAQVTFDTAHGGVGGDMGLFIPLDGTLKDFYCNARTLVMTQDEINDAYGYNPRAGGARAIDAGAHGSPKFTALTGQARAARARRIATFISESRAADTFIRDGAREAGLRFNGASAHLPYAVQEEPLWSRLQDILGGRAPR